MFAAGAVAEAVTLRNDYPEMSATQLEKKVAKRWLEHIQGPSNVSLVLGMLGMLKKIKGSEAAFIAGAIGTALNMAPGLIQMVDQSVSI